MKPSTTSSTTLSVRVQPGAKREGVAGMYGDAVKIAIAAPAVDGKANAALVRLLASLLGIASSRVEILSGHTSRSKVVRVLGVGSEELQRSLFPA